MKSQKNYLVEIYIPVWYIIYIFIFLFIYNGRFDTFIKIINMFK